MIHRISRFLEGVGEVTDHAEFVGEESRQQPVGHQTAFLTAVGTAAKVDVFDLFAFADFGETFVGIGIVSDEHIIGNVDMFADIVNAFRGIDGGDGFETGFLAQTELPHGAGKSFFMQVCFIVTEIIPVVVFGTAVFFDQCIVAAQNIFKTFAQFGEFIPELFHAVLFVAEFAGAFKTGFFGGAAFGLNSGEDDRSVHADIFAGILDFGYRRIKTHGVVEMDAVHTVIGHIFKVALGDFGCIGAFLVMISIAVCCPEHVCGFFQFEGKHTERDRQ